MSVQNLQEVTAGAPAETGLINIYSARNLGDAAIMSALGQLSPRGHVVARRSDDIDEIDIRALEWAGDTNDCGRFVSVGGDIFNNARPSLVTRAFLGNVWQLYQRRRKAILFGQTIPASCQGAALQLLARVLRNLPAVVVRDEASLALLRAHGVDAQLSFDTAFALEPTLSGEQAARSLFEATGLEPERTTLLSVRSFDALYPHDREHFVERMVQLANRLSDRGHQVAVPIQSDVSANDSDRLLANELAGRTDAISVLDLFAPLSEEDDYVERLVGAMAIANIVVGVRYHATVLRLAAGRMPYNLSYSRKGEDIGRRLNLCGAELAAFDPDQEVAAIEATAAQDFDVALIRANVRESFAHAYGTLH
ncbi:MAG: polysaccharide pyruvyl transferase family protein [Pseudomonadota bacterium]